MIKVPTMRKRILALTVILLILLVLCGCSSQGKDQRLPVRVLLLPKFELGEMAGDFPGEAWADRQPRVMRGTSVTSDSYWKGKYDHQNAQLITETYACADPFAISEMEDIAVCQAVKSFGLLDRLIILRVGVNMDVLPTGVTPEMLWEPESNDHVASESSMESVDIFETAMQNCFAAGKVWIDSILEGTL